jgi:negative regulator of flagellin synthesis FlgM
VRHHPFVHIDPRRAQSTPSVVPASRVRRAASQSAASAASSDSVSLSSEARSLATSRRAVEAAPDVREDRVAELKQRIARGEYNVPPDVLARKLLKKTTI